MVEEAIDSFGVSIPLLEFHNLHSRCPGADSDAVDAQSSDTPESENSDDEDEDDEYKEDKEDSGTRSLFKKFGFTTTTKPLLESHPYIITRFVNLLRSLYLFFTDMCIGHSSVSWT